MPSSFLKSCMLKTKKVAPAASSTDQSLSVRWVSDVDKDRVNQADIAEGMISDPGVYTREEEAFFNEGEEKIGRSSSSSTRN